MFRVWARVDRPQEDDGECFGSFTIPGFDQYAIFATNWEMFSGMRACIKLAIILNGV